MPIKVKYSPSAAAIGESAYTIGRGEKQRWAAEMAQRQQALNLQARGQELGAERAGEQLAQRQDEFEYGKEQDAADRAAAELSRVTAERRWNEEPSRQLQKGLQQQEQLQKNVAWQYDEGQKREMAHITTGIAWLRSQVSSGKWTAEQGEQAEQQLWQKYYSIIPLPVYDDKPTTQESYDSGMATDRTTGAQYRQKGNGDWEQVGIKFAEYSKLYADISAQYTTKDKEGNPIPPDPEVVHKAVMGAISRFAQIQGLAAKAEEQEQKEKMRLAKLEQDPTKVLQKHPIGIRKVEPAKREVAPEVDLTKLGKADKATVERFRSNNAIKWSWVRQKYGQETAEELKYICGSGNEQAIANALDRMGII